MVRTGRPFRRYLCHSPQAKRLFVAVRISRNQPLRLVVDGFIAVPEATRAPFRVRLVGGLEEEE